MRKAPGTLDGVSVSISLMRNLRPAIAQLLLTPAANAEDAIGLLHRMQSALGGARLTRIHDLEWSVKAKVWDRGREAGQVTRRIRMILPDRFRKDQDMPNGHTNFYFDGSSGWGSFGNSPIAPLDGSELEMVRNEVTGFWLNLWRADIIGGYDVEVCAPNTLRFRRKDGNQKSSDIEIDPKTLLPRRTGDLCHTGRKTPSGNHTEIAEWRVVDGVKLPQRIVNFLGGEMIADIYTTEAKLDTGLRVSDLAQRPSSK